VWDFVLFGFWLCFGFGGFDIRFMLFFSKIWLIWILGCLDYLGIILALLIRFRIIFEVFLFYICVNWILGCLELGFFLLLLRLE
jgi:hypothetical protein